MKLNLHEAPVYQYVVAVADCINTSWRRTWTHSAASTKRRTLLTWLHPGHRPISSPRPQQPYSLLLDSHRFTCHSNFPTASISSVFPSSSLPVNKNQSEMSSKPAFVTISRTSADLQRLIYALYRLTWTPKRQLLRDMDDDYDMLKI